MGIERDRESSREWKGRSEIFWEGGEVGGSAHQTLHTNFVGVWKGMTSCGQGGEGLKSEAEEGLKSDVGRRKPEREE